MLEGFRRQLGWSKSELARRAKVTKKTALNAEKGELITPNTARKIAQALSEGLGRTVLPGDIEGLNQRIEAQDAQ